MTYIPDAIRQLVIERARGCCEYCLVHQDDVYASHEIDHIIAIKHRGETVEENLCLSCARCNRFKSSHIASIDLDTKTVVRLFHPRKDKWDDHFQLDKTIIEPLTAIGRVTEFILQMNANDQLLRREELLRSDRYPCP